MRKQALLLLLVLVAGCGGDTALRDGRRLIEQGRVEEGIYRLEQGVKAHPDDEALRTFYARSRDLYINQLLYEGEKARKLGQVERALAAFRRALELNPDSARAQAGLQAAEAELRQRDAVRQAQAAFDAGNPDEALVKVKAVLRENPSQKDAQALQRKIEESRARPAAGEPQLKAAYKKPVTLEFRDAPLQSVFDVMSRASGINFVLDHDVRPDIRVTIFVRDTSIEDALSFLLVTNQLAKKVLNENTILVYPNLPNKVRDYQELVVRSFYLGNADVKQTLNMIKTVVKTRDVFVDERLNLLVMRDTPDAIRIAEKLIAAQDLAEPEVVLEMEVLEVTRAKLQNLGAQYPTEVSAGVEGAAGTPGQITLSEWLNRNAGLVNLKVTDPAFIINLQRQDSDTNLLANPRIRVKNREKAKIHIGDKVPVITTTSTANVGVSESVQYLDVGLKLDVEPVVSLDDQVSIKMGLEVSNIVQQITSPQGTVTYRIGTRNTATALRVANGETQVLAGLIQDQDQRTADKVPGLADLPILGRLFTNNNDSRTKTEIVLLITPYVVHNLDRPPPSALEIASGTESSLGAAPLRLPTAMPTALPIQQPPRPQPPVPGQAPGVQAPPAGAPGAQTLLLSAPLQAPAGSDFAVAVSVPTGTTGAVQVDLLYDPGKLAAVGAQGSPGRVPLEVSGTASVRFHALPGQSGPAQISIGSISGGAGPAGEPVQLTAPAPVTVNITP
ncbi:MAG TPA: tetratricopeptide repeat protein [Burkholderiales bacterium]|nr:tetratricopeptide repeat protein [Burkholderiales bacterium]